MFGLTLQDFSTNNAFPDDFRSAEAYGYLRNDVSVSMISEYTGMLRSLGYTHTDSYENSNFYSKGKILVQVFMGNFDELVIIAIYEYH